jgi:mono/diheme cytochrome c family protein
MMHTIARILYPGILSALFIAHAYAEGDAAAGKELAREMCARCHNIEPNGAFKQHPPSFAAIAVYRSEEQIFGRIVFPPLHAAMPQIGYMLTPDNVEHLVAYIRSLEAD